MGFRIDKNRVVHLDPTTLEFGDTSRQRNPTSTQTLCTHNPLTVHSLVLRRAAKASVKGMGDNCPLIYALKRRDGLTVTYSSIKPIIRLIDDLLNKFKAQVYTHESHFDAILPMPSSHKLSTWLARRFSEITGIHIIEGVLQKVDSDALEQQLLLDRFNQQLIPHKARTNIMNAVKHSRRNNVPFSISQVATHYRKYLTPVLLVDTDFSDKSRILLVDDLFASGRTLIAAKNEILRQHPHLKIEALCLFSPLNGRARKP